MKSGFDNLESKDETVENTASIVVTFMQNGMKNSDIYVKHAKRAEITPEDIKRGLMLEVFFMKSRPDILEQCEEVKQKIKDIIKDEEENGEEMYIEQDRDNEECEEFKESTCECPMCNCFNTIYSRWERFTPELPMEKILVNCINAIETTV
tara:strand:+ start:306 stop:758 length:453 start_codon:yes stop_codon:yes gene_type:complete